MNWQIPHEWIGGGWVSTEDFRRARRTLSELEDQ